VDTAALVTFLSTEWTLSEVTAAPIQGHWRSGTYHVSAREGRFMAKIRDWNGGSADDLALLAYLRDRGYPYVTQLLLTRSGQNQARCSEQHAVYVYSYFDGDHDDTAEGWAALGIAVAALHLIPTEDSPVREVMPLDSIVVHIVRDRAPGLPFADEYVRLAKLLAPIEGSPTCLIHGDVSPVNAVRNSAGETVLIDWDGSGIGARVYDLGSPLANIVSLDGVSNEDGIRAFYRSYHSVRPITDEDLVLAWDAAMLPIMNYIRTGDTIAQKWSRIQWMAKQRAYLTDFIDSCRR
jgi:Ser/Thr protein kinase RdoA (MazF antagonist)